MDPLAARSIVLIAGISGITDIAALWGLFGLTAAMILFGWLMETTNQLGAQTGVLDALRDGLRRRCRSMAGAGSDVPNFVYGIFVSLFLLFNCFAVNQFLQYRRVGPWRNYHFGEAPFVVLSLVAKSALAWQVFANVLV